MTDTAATETSPTAHDFLAQLLDGASLTEQQAERAFTLLLEGAMLPEQVAGLLALLQAKGVTTGELVGAARVMRRFVTPVEAAGKSLPLIDTCGTGGAPKTFNVSTASAIVAAATGLVRVAKHGNRSRTGRGSAEVLAALGVNIDAAPAAQARCLNEAGVCFSFAIHHHPAMKHAVGPRKALGFPTIFNLLGPLTNPAGATRQLLGVYDAHKAELVANALGALKTERAIVAHGLDGLDEITTTDSTLIFHVYGDEVTQETLRPGDLGIERCSLDDLRVSTVEESAAVIREVLAGKEGPKADIVCLNAAAALLAGGVVGGVQGSIADALAMARGAIASGKATETLNKLAEASQ